MVEWMPPLPEPDVIVHYTADQMRRAQADAARAALVEVDRQIAEKTGRSIAARLVIRAMAKEIT